MFQKAFGDKKINRNAGNRLISQSSRRSTDFLTPSTDKPVKESDPAFKKLFFQTSASLKNHFKKPALCSYPKGPRQM